MSDDDKKFKFGPAATEAMKSAMRGYVGELIAGKSPGIEGHMQFLMRTAIGVLVDQIFDAIKDGRHVRIEIDGAALLDTRRPPEEPSS